jgi:glutathione S-transferase
MLTFYHHPLSPVSRRVWIALIEKGLEFEPIVVKLNEKQQFQPKFLALNPFHHVPVLIDGGIRLIESLAILDYLELQYPELALMPSTAAAIARVKMIQMVALSELFPRVIEFIMAGSTTQRESIQRQTLTALTFFETELGEAPFFGENCLSLADIVLGLTVSTLCRLGLDLSGFPRLVSWQQMICSRPAWQFTRPPDQDFENWKRFIQIQAKRQSA